MAEKRKADFVIALKRPGKKACKIELFVARKFEQKCKKYSLWGWQLWAKYRLRVNGKWFKGDKGDGKIIEFLTWYEVRDLIWRTFKPEKW